MCKAFGPFPFHLPEGTILLTQGRICATHTVQYKRWKIEAYLNDELLTGALAGNSDDQNLLRHILHDSFVSEHEEFNETEIILVWNFLKIEEIPHAQPSAKRSEFADDMLVVFAS